MSPLTKNGPLSEREDLIDRDMRDNIFKSLKTLIRNNTKETKKKDSVREIFYLRTDIVS